MSEPEKEKKDGRINLPAAGLGAASAGAVGFGALTIGAVAVGLFAVGALVIGGVAYSKKRKRDNGQDGEDAAG